MEPEMGWLGRYCLFNRRDSDEDYKLLLIDRNIEKAKRTVVPIVRLQATEMDIVQRNERRSVSQSGFHAIPCFKPQTRVNSQALLSVSFEKLRQYVRIAHIRQPAHWR